jgi:hypothetical protein
MHKDGMTDSEIEAVSFKRYIIDFGLYELMLIRQLGENLPSFVQQRNGLVYSGISAALRKKRQKFDAQVTKSAPEVDDFTWSIQVPDLLDEELQVVVVKI